MVSHVNRLGGQGYETINTRCTLLVVAENPGRNQLDKAAKMARPDDHLGGMVGTRFQLPGNHQAEARRR